MARNIMVDLETLGTCPGSAILSIGAVEFDEGGVLPNEFHELIYTPSCLDVFLTVDTATEQWWKKQDKAARAVLAQCNDMTQSHPIRDVLEMFSGFVKSCGDDVQVWGNGSDFDNALLAVAYAVCGYPLPWRFFNNRCYRTLKNLHPDIKLKRTGVYHCAVDDARTQAEHAARLLQRQEVLRAAFGEGSGEALQQEGFARPEGGQHQADPAGDRVPRSPVPTGLRV